VSTPSLVLLPLKADALCWGHRARSRGNNSYLCINIDTDMFSRTTDNAMHGLQTKSGRPWHRNLVIQSLLLFNCSPCTMRVSHPTSSQICKVFALPQLSDHICWV
jgi:hypothetical protein